MKGLRWWWWWGGGGGGEGWGENASVKHQMSFTTCSFNKNFKRMYLWRSYVPCIYMRARLRVTVVTVLV